MAGWRMKLVAMVVFRLVAASPLFAALRAALAAAGGMPFPHSSTLFFADG
jgi:hypothetical protein